MDKQVFINKILTETLKKIQDEVGGLLGQDFSCPKPSHRLISRDDLFATLSGKAVLATLSISGDNSGTAYLVVGLKDAISLGGTLILLPPDEMEQRREQNLFDDEVDDAYGEIANIIAGVYTAVFTEHANPKLHFKKTGLTPFSPDDPNGPVPAGTYYVSTCPTQLANKPLGTLSVLIPPELLGLEPPPEVAEAAATASQPSTSASGQPKGAPPGEKPTAGAMPESPSTPAQTGVSAPAAKSASTAGQAAAPTQPSAASETESDAEQITPEGEKPPSTGPSANRISPSASTEPPVILVVSETLQSAEAFAHSFMDRCNCTVTCMHFQGDFLTNTRGKNVKGVFLAMREVGDRGLASIIKIQSAVGEVPPLVAAGPEWTRKTVLQAVKYGASDILVTPATPEEVLEKIDKHMQLPPN